MRSNIEYIDTWKFVEAGNEPEEFVKLDGKWVTKSAYAKAIINRSWIGEPEVSKINIGYIPTYFDSFVHFLGFDVPKSIGFIK